MQYTTAELARRMERVRVLIDTHDEVYDDLSRAETSSAQPGFGEPARRVLRCVCGGAGCGQCERSAAYAGELGYSLKPGQVLVEVRDPYDTGREGSFDPAARTRREDAARIDDILDRLREDELVRAGVLAATVDFEKELEAGERRDGRGSYRELRAALDVMPRRLRGERAIGWLAEHMPARINVPLWARQAEADRLAEQIKSLYVLGRGRREIAVELSISASQVRRVLREQR